MADEPTAAKDAGTSAPPPDGASELRSVHTTTLPELLNQLQCSLLVSTYQAGKLIAVRSEGAKANTHFRNFRQPMGLAWQGNRLAIGTLTQVCEFQNQADVVRRLPDPDDRRAVQVELTEHGRKVWEEALRTGAAQEALIAAALTKEEKQQLNALLRRLMLEFERRESAKDS